MDAIASIEVFLDENAGVESIGIVMRGVSIVEYKGDELTPGCNLTPWHARCLAQALIEMADRIDRPQSI